MASSCGAVVALAAVSACLPITRTHRNDDVVQRAFELDVERKPPVLALAVDNTAAVLSLGLDSVTSCLRERRERVLRWEVTHKTTNTPAHAILYGLGLLGGAAGGGIIWDNSRPEGSESERKVALGSTVAEAKAIGIGTASAGGLLLLIALGSSLRAVDERAFVGSVDRPVAGTSHLVECDRKPAGNHNLGLVLATDGVASVYVPLGRTDGAGHLKVAWDALTSTLPAGVRPEAKIVAGEADQVGAILVKHGEITVLATITVPAEGDPEHAWIAAQRLDTFEAYRGYRERFPRSAHAPEAESRAKAISVKTTLADLDAALAADDEQRAAAAIDRLRKLGDAATVEPMQHRYDTMVSAHRAREVMASVPKLLAAIEESPDPQPSLAAAAASIDQLRASSPEEAARLDAQLQAARERATARLVKEGEDAAGKRDLARAQARFAVAAAISPTPAAVQAARAAALAKAIKAGKDAARGAARAQRYDDAVAILGELVAIAPDDKSLAGERVRWAAAAKRAEDAAAERSAREAALEEAARQREAAAEAQRIAREQQQRDAATKKAKDAADRAEQQRLADDKRRADDAARKQREDDARHAEEAKRVAAEQEKERGRLAEQAKAEEAKRKAEEDKRRAAAAKLDAQIAKAQQPAAPASVQFDLAPKFAADDVLKRLPVPKSCSATLGQFVGRTADGDHAMTRVDMTCGAVAFAFIRDRQHVWLTCKATDKALPCADCLAAGQAALAPFAGASGKLTVVQGCPR